jgi:hypothetical protein
MADELTLRMKQFRTRRHLEQTPDLVAHMLSLVAPQAGTTKYAPRVSGSKDPGLPLNARALEDANNLYAQLVNWAISHAHTLEVKPPSISLAWARKQVDCDGFPSWATVSDAAELTFDIADWLVMGGEKISHTPSAEVYFDDVHDIVNPLYGRYQWAQTRQVVSAVTCPVCDNRTVIVDFDAEPLSVACTFCGHPIRVELSQKYLDELLVVHAEEQAEREWWTIDDAVANAQVSHRTVYRYIQEGMPTVRGRLFRRSDFLAERRRRLLNQASSRHTSL